MCIATDISGFERQGVVGRDHLRGVVCGGVDIGELAFGRHVDLSNYLMLKLPVMGTRMTRRKDTESEE